MPARQSGVSAVTVVGVVPPLTIVNSLSTGAPRRDVLVGLTGGAANQNADQGAERFPRGWRKRPFHLRLL